MSDIGRDTYGWVSCAMLGIVTVLGAIVGWMAYRWIAVCP